MKKKIITLFFMIFVTTFTFNVTPTFFEKRLDAEGGYQEYVLKNNSDSTIRYKVSVLPGLGKLPSMDQWVEYSPKVITVKPKSESILKVYIKSPKGTPEGEYSALLNMKTINLPKMPKDDGQTVAATTRLGIDVSLEISGYVGDFPSKLEILNLKMVENKDKKNVLTFNVKNKTQKRGVYYTIDVIGKNGTYVSLEKGRIKPDGDDEVKITLNEAKKSDIVGVSLRDPNSNLEITKKEL